VQSLPFGFLLPPIDTELAISPAFGPANREQVLLLLPFIGFEV
jgi:hypothetical protein